MKKYLLAVCLCLMLAVPAYSAGTVSSTWTLITDGIYELAFSWTADAAAATVPATASLTFNGFIYSCDTNPGGTAPTDDYDITLVNADGIDVMGGALLDRDATASERAYASNTPYVVGGVTFTLANNLVVSATGTCKCIVFQ